MNKEEIVKILEAVLLLFENVPEKEVVKLLDEYTVSCAKYILGFLQSYKK